MYPIYPYNYGYGCYQGVGFIPEPVRLNSEANTHVYRSHYEHNDSSTITILSMAAIGALAGLLLAHKSNQTEKLIQIAKNDPRVVSGTADIVVGKP